MKEHKYWVYITTNPTRKVIYIGVTNNLSLRINQHFQNRGNRSSFAGKYYCYNLIYFEEYRYIDMAIKREKQLKRWTRNKKDELIYRVNPKLEFKNVLLNDMPYS